MSPDGTRAWIPSKKDNILRGTLRDGNGLTHDQSVRLITSVIDLGNHSDLPAERRDYDNLDRAHAVAFSPLGDLAFVTQPGNNLVEVVDAYTRTTVTQLRVGKTPTGILLDPVHKRLFVLNFLDRSLSAFDINGLVNATGDSAPELAPAASLIASESLSAQVLHGKQLFYNANSTRLNEEGYMSCASCHGGESYTDSSTTALHDVGTLKSSSGNRLGDDLTGIDTPTLRGIWDTAPYFHDGSAPDLAAVLSTGPHHDVSGTLDATGTARLIAWLQQIDHTDPATGLIPATIEFAALPPKTPADPPFNLAATASSGLAVAFASFDPAVATIAGDLLTIQGSGTTTITATQPGNALHPAALPVEQTLIVSTLDPLFATYLTDHFTPQQLADPLISGPLADLDNDGVPNLLEYALGSTDPTDRDSAFPVLTSPRLPPPGPQLRITFLRRSGGTETGGSYISGDLTYQPIASTDLTHWNIAPVSVPNPPCLPAAPDGFEWTSYAIPDGPETEDKGFIKLKVNAE
jgi:hypothetical protein